MTTEFSRYLRRRRQALGKSQREVAESIGLTEMSITLVEGGRRRLALERVPRLAAALQVDPPELCLLALRCWHPELSAALPMPEVQ